MLTCLKNGTRIKIIHTVNRGVNEMLAAIQSWLPLYMTGLVESYVSRKTGDQRFSNTCFFCPGKACMKGTCVRGHEKESWYEYFNDPRKLESIQNQYQVLFEQSDLLMRVYIRNQDLSLFDRKIETSRIFYSLLSSLSFDTMPEALLVRILRRNCIPEAEKQRIMELWQQSRRKLGLALENSNVWQFTTVEKLPLAENRKVVPSIDTVSEEWGFSYTPEEYREHLEAVRSLASENPSFHLVELDGNLFGGIQIFWHSSHVLVLKQKTPNAAFVFTHPLMVQAFHDFFQNLRNR